MKDVERISSQELSGLMKVTASQIRQDFNNFGGFGQQGYGYNVESLYREIGKILGLDKQHNFVIIGAGNLGRALGNYMNFERRGFIFKGMFDANPELVGKDVRGVKVMPMDQLESFIRENDIDIAVLTIPKTSAVEVADKLVANGIRAIWNFAHVDLNVPEGIQVENVHLSDSLMKLSYNINRYSSDMEISKRMIAYFHRPECLKMNKRKSRNAMTDAKQPLFMNFSAPRNNTI